MTPGVVGNERTVVVLSDGYGGVGQEVIAEDAFYSHEGRSEP
jgi:hypothetical protein